MLQLKSNTWKKKSIENDPYFTNVKCEERFDGNEMTVFWKAWKAIAYDNLRANLLLVETIEPRSKGKSEKPRNKKLKNNERGMKGKMTHAHYSAQFHTLCDVIIQIIWQMIHKYVTISMRTFSQTFLNSGLVFQIFGHTYFTWMLINN